MSIFEEIKTGLEQAINGEGKVLLSPEQQRNKELIDRHPFLLPRSVWTDEVDEDYDYSYIFPLEIPRGWYKLFFQLCEDIRQPLIDADYLDKFRLLQVKEKFNRLEVYNQGAPEAVQDIIDKYSMMAGYVCTVCGKPATYETHGYIASYCDDCWKDYAKHDKGEWIKFKPEYIVRRFNKNGSGLISETISFEDEWNRYLKSLEVA